MTDVCTLHRIYCSNAPDVLLNSPGLQSMHEVSDETFEPATATQTDLEILSTLKVFIHFNISGKHYYVMLSTQIKQTDIKSRISESFAWRLNFMYISNEDMQRAMLAPLDLNGKTVNKHTQVDIPAGPYDPESHA